MFNNFFSFFSASSRASRAIKNAEKAIAKAEKAIKATEIKEVVVVIESSEVVKAAEEIIKTAAPVAVASVIFPSPAIVAAERILKFNKKLSKKEKSLILASIEEEIKKVDAEIAINAATIIAAKAELDSMNVVAPIIVKKHSIVNRIKSYGKKIVKKIANKLNKCVKVEEKTVEVISLTEDAEKSAEKVVNVVASFVGMFAIAFLIFLIIISFGKLPVA